MVAPTSKENQKQFLSIERQLVELASVEGEYTLELKWYLSGAISTSEWLRFLTVGKRFIRALYHISVRKDSDLIMNLVRRAGTHVTHDVL